ncbi:hypothetical protein UT300013_33740 [Paraclostridium sordellii]
MKGNFKLVIVFFIIKFSLMYIVLKIFSWILDKYYKNKIE